jgi:glycosyltransferase involved in cell wall biosynthesis/GT2 family glycosyltransferase
MDATAQLPLVSCIMPTRDRRAFVARAIGYFLRQDYPHAELVIVDDGADPVGDLAAADERITYLRLPGVLSVGAKRNLACEAARGALIAHWDDDDWYAPDRLRRQVEALGRTGAAVCGVSRLAFYDLQAARAWRYVYPDDQPPWLIGSSLCFARETWERQRFKAIDVGEDAYFVWALPRERVHALAGHDLMVGIIHGRNVSPKLTDTPWWRPAPVEPIRALLGADWPFYGDCLSVPKVLPNPQSLSSICIGVHAHADPEALLATLASLRANTPRASALLLLPDDPDEELRRALCALPIPQLPAGAPGGGAACLNRLAAASDAGLLVLLESGSLVGPGWLDHLVAALEADPRNGLAGPATNRAWNEQGAFPGVADTPAAVAAAAREAFRRFGRQARTLEPLHSLADFCYAVRREVVEAIGAADEGYGRGPCWEMDYNIRAARAGFRGVWAGAAYVHRLPATEHRRRDEAEHFGANVHRYQDHFCALRLLNTRDAYEPHCRGDACEHFAPPAQIAIHRPLPAPTLHPSPSTLHPLISCITPTRDRIPFLLQSIAYFQRQDYPNRELIVVDDGPRSLAGVLPDDPRVRYVHLPAQRSIGAKRNLACELARGSIVVHWDDDDWYGPERLSLQAAPLLRGEADISALPAGVFFDLPRWQFWACTPELHRRLFVGDVHGGTLMFKRWVWQLLGAYPDASLAEDAAFLSQALALGARLERVDGGDSFVYLRHAGNAWSFTCGEYLGPGGWRRVAEPPFSPEDRRFYAAFAP